MSEKEILTLLSLEMKRAENEGLIKKLQEENRALSNAIWRRTTFCKELSKSA